MPVHEEVLIAAIRIGGERGDWTFTPNEIVRALPHQNERTVRTHVVSRCCLNAPKNHPHKWDYFRRIAHGRYEVLAARRPSPPERQRRSERSFKKEKTSVVRRDTIHAVISKSEDVFVAECLEVAVVTQGHTLDESLANLREALDLHLDGEDLGALGLSDSPRLSVTYEMSLARNAEA